MSLLTWFLRLSCAIGDRKRDKGLVAPAGISLKKDIKYGPHKKQLLDLYLPDGAGRETPIIVSVHGGGWVYGDKELYRHYCMDLAVRGFAVVNFTYRLSPENKFPCQLEDTALAFKWIAANAESFGLSMENLFAVGDSAGGHLLSLYCALLTNPEYAATYPFSVEGAPLPNAVALNCGVYDLPSAKGAAKNSLMLMRDVLGHKATEAELIAMSPAYHIKSGFPPSYVMTSNDDFLRDQPQPLLAAFDKAGVPYEFYDYGDDSLRLGHVFHLDIRTEIAIACNDAECEFFRKTKRESAEK